MRDNMWCHVHVFVFYIKQQPNFAPIQDVQFTWCGVIGVTYVFYVMLHNFYSGNTYVTIAELLSECCDLILLHLLKVFYPLLLHVSAVVAAHHRPPCTHHAVFSSVSSPLDYLVLSGITSSIYN